MKKIKSQMYDKNMIYINVFIIKYKYNCRYIYKYGFPYFRFNKQHMCN